MPSATPRARRIAATILPRKTIGTAITVAWAIGTMRLVV
jgi:hypothetical protein